MVGFAQEMDSLVVDSIHVDQVISVDSVIASADSTIMEPEDTIKIERKFLTIGPYIDISKLLTIPADFETKYEGGLELRFSERFSIYAEAGSATTSPKQAYTNGTYESTGTYYRLGLGYVGPLDLEHDIGISFRYGSATYDEDGRVFISSPSGGQADLVQSISRKGLTAQWWEVVLYSDRKLLENSDLLWLGLNLRLRILDSYDTQEAPDTYAIPGYGRTFDKSIPAVNFFLKIKIWFLKNVLETLKNINFYRARKNIDCLCSKLWLI